MEEKKSTQEVTSWTLTWIYHFVCYRKSLHHVTPKWVVLQCTGNTENATDFRWILRRNFVRVTFQRNSSVIPPISRIFHGSNGFLMELGFLFLHVRSVLGPNWLFHLGLQKKLDRESPSKVCKMLGCLKCKYENANTFLFANALCA